MNVIVPVAIVCSLGICSGLILRLWLSNIFLTAFLAGIAATILWGIGMEILFALTIPEKDMGATHYKPIFYTFLTAMVALFVILNLIGKKDTNTNEAIEEN